MAKLSKEELQQLEEEKKKYQNLIIEAAPTIAKIEKTVGEFEKELKKKDEPVIFTDFDKLKSEAQKRAEEVIDSKIAEFGLDINDDYIKAKREMDIIQLTPIINKLIVTEWVDKKLLEEIDSGVISARIVEVQSNNTRNTVALVEFLRKLENDITGTYATMHEFKQHFSKKDENQYKLIESTIQDEKDGMPDVLNFNELMDELNKDNENINEENDNDD